jgi:hypothetical protein
VTLAWALFAPLAVQSTAMGVDEFHFHRKRGLGRWERVGHPLDTLTVLSCIGWTIFKRPSRGSVAVYVVLAITSCLFVTKDEFVHAGRCSPGEHWLHAILFLIHPISLASVALLWPVFWPGVPAVTSWLAGAGAGVARALAAQFALTAVFCAYQALYWNFPWPRRTALAP